jgi:hypothetical protein
VTGDVALPGRSLPNTKSIHIGKFSFTTAFLICFRSASTTRCSNWASRNAMRNIWQPSCRQAGRRTRRFEKESARASHLAADSARSGFGKPKFGKPGMMPVNLVPR